LNCDSQSKLIKLQVEGQDFSTLKIAPSPILFAVKAFQKVKTYEDGEQVIEHYFAFQLELYRHTLLCKQKNNGRVVLLLDGSNTCFYYCNLEDLKEGGRTFALELREEVFESSLAFDTDT